MYLAIKVKLGDGYTEPPGYPNLGQYRVIDMFTRVLTPPKKEEVVSLFSKKTRKPAFNHSNSCIQDGH